MNLRNLNEVFANYIEKFEWLNQKPEPDESYKWIAVKNFQSALDLDVADEEFAAMLQKAKKSTENLIDSSQQPFGALCEYAKAEPATVRMMFKELFAEDGGDLIRRQRKIDDFLLRADELLKKYYPTSHMFINTQQSAMAYLWFYDPDTYYHYKATEAKYLADCVEFYDDWGTYSDFNLTVYHRFCDEIIAQMKNHPELMETHRSRFEGCGEIMHADEKLHILIVDIIFCAKRYGLYNGIPIKDSSAPAKRLYQERKAKAAELLADVEAAGKNAALLEEARKAFTEMANSGAEITHKAFGKAELTELSDGYCTLFFAAKNEQKKFGFLSSLAGGFIRMSHPDFDGLLEKYRPVMKAEMNVSRRMEMAIKALEPYKEYLD